MMVLRALFLALLLVMASSTLAQDENEPLITQIGYDAVVTETINDTAFFDWWRLNAEEGDIIVVEMLAADGLVPLIGILDEGGNLVARSDANEAPTADATVMVEYTAEASIQYTIVATRAGRDNGTSTGSYVLRVRRANPTPVRDNPYQAVEFRCDDLLVTTALSIEFNEDIQVPDDPGQPVEFYRLTVYGLDGFHPVIRVFAEVQEAELDCSDNGDSMPGSSYTLPDGTTATITEDDLDSVAQISLRNSNLAETFGTVNYIIGSLDGQPGRYMAVLEGLSIHERGDRDRLRLRLGPLARETDLQVYMVGGLSNRLDPVMRWSNDDEDPFAECDDAGRRGCEALPDFTDAGTELALEGVVIAGDRFDAGLLLNPGTPDPMTIDLFSRADSTTGDYALVFIGELPPRDADGGE